MMKTNHKAQRRWIVAAVAAVALGGCGTNHDQLMGFLATASTTPAGCQEYKVMPPDTLTITARPTAEFDGLKVRVGPDGKAFLPLIGNYLLAGKTTTQIANELTEGLLDYYEDVQVTVTVTGYRSQRFYVFGEVSRPGVYPYTGNDTLISALATAQPTRLAAPEKISVIRGLDPLPGDNGVPLDQEGRLRNATHKVTINLSTLVRGEGQPTNFMIADNDVIYVPANPFAKVGLGLQQVLFPIRPMVTTMGTPYDMADAAAGEE